MKTTKPRASASRDANLRRLVAELQIQPLCRDDIQSMFNCSATHVRNYIAILGGLIKTIDRRRNLQHVYEITSDQRRIDAFLAKLPQPEEPKPPKEKRAAALPDPTRHIHIMDDDAPFRVPMCHVRPQHPAIHAAFWGVAV